MFAVLLDIYCYFVSSFEIKFVQKKGVDCCIRLFKSLTCNVRKPNFDACDNEGTDLSAHPRNLFNAFGIRYLERRVRPL